MNFIIAILCLLIGIAIGIYIDSKIEPNTIILWATYTNKYKMVRVIKLENNYVYFKASGIEDTVILSRDDFLQQFTLVKE